MVILALDDEIGALKILKRVVLQVQPDAEINIFDDVDEAFEFVEGHKIDVAFLDIQMPTMTGTEVAKKLMEMQPNVNVIFTTGYGEYALEAMKMHSSGYIMKPVTRADVEAELNSLRNPIGGAEEEQEPHIRMQTFGNFEIFVDGKAVPFRRERTREMLAYLVDRRGALVTRKELSASLFEDREYSRSTQTYLTQIVQSLKKVLDEAGIPELLVVEYNGYAVDTRTFSCDSYDFLDGKPGAEHLFHGEYMGIYSWAEDRLYQFEDDL